MEDMAPPFERSKSPATIFGKQRKVRPAKDYPELSDPNPRGAFWFNLDKAFFQIFSRHMRTTEKLVKKRIQSLPFDEALKVFRNLSIDGIARMIHSEAQDIIADRVKRVERIEVEFLDRNNRPLDAHERRRIEVMMEDDPSISDEAILHALFPGDT